MALEFSRVDGRFAVAIIDTDADPDDLPDIRFLTDGIVTFTPNPDMEHAVEPAYLEDGTPIPRMLIQQPVVARINAQGRLIDGAGHEYVKLVDLTSDSLNPRLDDDSMTHTVSFRDCRAGAIGVDIPSKPVSISGPGPHHLPSLLPVTTTSGEAVTVGPPGPGVESVFVDGNHLFYTIKDDETVYDAGSLEGVVVGQSAYEVAVANGYSGTETQWLASLVGAAGKSAYQQAVDAGFSGNLAQWLASLNGAPGKSAYQLAVDAGFSGTEAQWRASLKGDPGEPGIVVVDRGVGTVWSTGSTTLVDSTLVTGSLAPGRYLFEADLLISRSSTNGVVNVAIGGTHTSGFAKAVMTANGSLSTNGQESIISGKNAGQPVPSLSSADTTNIPVRIKGYVQVTAAGTVVLQLSVSTGTVAIETGSTMSLRGNLVAV